MPRTIALNDHFSAVYEQPVPGGTCQVGLDVRPDEVSFLARVKLYSRPSSEALPGSGGESREETVEERVAGFAASMDEILQRVQERVKPKLLAEACRLTAALADENLRLRAALSGCVSACEELLHRTDPQCEGHEGDQAQAWVALDAARQALNQPPLLNMQE